MKPKLYTKILSLVLVLAMLVTMVPATVFAEETDTAELYIKSVKLAQAKTKAEAQSILEEEGYTFLDKNLNEGTDNDGIWLGYTTTTDPTEAIYDMKLMNMKGGFTLTSMKDALAAQESAFAEMAVDLNYLIEEFTEAYEEGSVAAQKAYKALNFFRVVETESGLTEHNGLGYQIISGGMSQEKVTEMLMFCDPTLVDSVIRILAMGIQVSNGNWMKELSDKGPYDSDKEASDYFEDEDELKRRAEQLLMVLQLYSKAYNAMDLSGLIPDDLNENFEPEYTEEHQYVNLDAEDAAIKKLDENRYKIYKVVFDELEKYPYGSNGSTLKDFICSIELDGTAKQLYPLVSVLSDGEFAALSYGCFLEVALGANASASDFDAYDQVYANLTEEVQSVYLYAGVDKALLEEDSLVAFTDAANRHMASTGELEFYEKESLSEDVWETGKYTAMCIGAAGMAIIGVAKITMGVSMGITAIVGLVSSTTATALKSGMLAGVIKFCAAISGMPAFLIVAAVVAATALIAYLISVLLEDDDIDWEDNPMPEYIYDVKEVGFSQTSTNDGIATESIRRPVFVLYEAVTDVNDQVVDLNARSDDATQWIAMYVSYDSQGDETKPIKASDLLVKTGEGTTPDGYVPLSSFGQVIAYNLNRWDEDDDVNGVYMFYKQDQTVAVDDGRTYYIYDVYLQTGESDAHCIDLLEAAGYTPVNVNLSPSLEEEGWIYTYLGYKVTTSKSSAITDLRLVYGPAAGEIKYGEATYADCGSNGAVTLYATKYTSAGTALLAGGLICVDDRSNAPAGYEPVNFFAGGPAVTVNVTNNGVQYNTPEKFLYFLPETTFTSGVPYLGGIAYVYSTDYALSGPLYYTEYQKIILDYLKQKNGGTYNLQSEGGKIKAMYDYINLRMGYSTYTNIAVNGTGLDRVSFYQTYNPYRAIYGLQATAQKESDTRFVLENIGYYAWNTFQWYGPRMTGTAIKQTHLKSCYMYYNDQANAPELKLSGKVYVKGNPSTKNLYEASTAQMMYTQPLKMSDVLCVVQGDNTSKLSGSYKPLKELFDTSKDALVFKHEQSNTTFSFYTTENTETKPYVSSITAIDELTLYRMYGGHDAGLSLSTITNGMMLSQLASQGANSFNGYRVSLRQTDVWDSGIVDSYDEINAIKFGYTRVKESTNALRDVFLYFNGFSNDAPPSELYRGKTKYTLLCEIPYNLTGYNSAPKTGVYLYGTTDKKGGNPIIDFEVSGTPFMEGYETVRTMNGRSLVAEISEHVKTQKAKNPMSWAKKMYDTLISFFDNDDEKQQNAYFYLHIKREDDDLRKQEPYVGQLYLTSCYEDLPTALDDLFDQGADGYVNIDLNEDAGGDYVYLGYSYTANPADAVKEIRAYHKKNPPETLTDDDGHKFELVDDLDLNKDAGGDFIYLYASSESESGQPISALTAGYKVATGEASETWVDGKQVTATTFCVKKWNSNTNSDLNKGAGGEYIYLMYTTVNSTFEGTYVVPSYGSDKTYSRSEFKKKDPNGKYIGGLYLMDKNTIRLEKIAAGTLSARSTCADITDDEVFARLEAMGATEIIKTPIAVTGAEYFKGNQNSVFLGYSRTNTKSSAIRNVILKAEVLSLAEPSEKITIEKIPYYLVAEPADDVAELPRAINLIGTQDSQDLVLPKLYLYYSTADSRDPIYDICIDGDAIRNGWNTAESFNGLDPFTDIYSLAYEQYELADKDDSDNYDSEIVYTDALFEWMDDVAELFDPEDADVTPFYIHCKRYAEDTLEESKPYIGEIFIAEGDSRHEALSKLVAFEPDAYIDCDLNRKAGGNHVYAAYKRAAKVKDALTDLVVFEGKNPELTRRLDIDGSSIKYTLVEGVDLNSDAGGKYLYLYSTDSTKTGNPITNLSISDKIVSSLKCGDEKVTVKRAEGKSITSESIDLNKGAGGDYLYMVMQRQSNGGHRKGEVLKETIVNATCGEDGSKTTIAKCLDCSAEVEYVEVLKATGEHIDVLTDKDHKCDVCGKADITAHTAGEVQKEDVVEATCVAAGSYHAVVECTQCGKVMRDTVIQIAIDPDAHTDGKDPDHNCDICGAVNVEDHTPGEPVEMDRVEPSEDTDGSYVKVISCTECQEKLSEETIVIPALGKNEPGEETTDDVRPEAEEPNGEDSGEDGQKHSASIFGKGSLIAICSFVGLAALAAIIVFIKKQKEDEGDA